MAYEKPKLIDLNGETEKGYGQQGPRCQNGSGNDGFCENGSAATGFCITGAAGRTRIEP